MKVFKSALFAFSLAVFAPQVAQATSPPSSFVDLVESTSLPGGELAIIATYNPVLISTKAGLSGEITLLVKIIDQETGEVTVFSNQATLSGDSIWIGNIPWNASGYKKYVVILSADIGGSVIRLGRSVKYLHRSEGQVEQVTRGQFDRGFFSVKTPQPNAKLEPGDIPGEARNSN